MFSCNVLRLSLILLKSRSRNQIVEYKKQKMHALLKRIWGLLPWLLEVAYSDMYFEENKNWSSLEYTEMIGNFRPAKQDSFQNGKAS